MRVCVVGTGYVGLVSGVCLAEKGHEVVCIDVDPAKIEKIRSGVPPIFEDGLDALLAQNLGNGFTASGDLRAAVRGADLTLIAVGTPFDGRKIDLKYVGRVAEQIGEILREMDAYHVVVVKSTVVPGTTDTFVRKIVEESSGKRAGADFGLGMNPEFLTEGQAIADFMHPDRIVVGGIDERTLDVLEALYAPFPASIPRIRTNPRTAEMIKYASNALLATAISFSNEIANLCTALGDVDIVEVMGGVHASSYLTVETGSGERVKAPITSFFGAGCGFGGSCLPKDVKALTTHGEAQGLPMSMLHAVMAVNDGQPREITRILEKHFPSLSGLRIGLLGLAFKPGTDDVRESPAFPIARALRAAGASVKAFDPVAIETARQVLGDEVQYAKSLAECLEDVDALVLVTRWKEFEEVPEMLRGRPKPPLLVDGRRLLDKRSVDRYAGIGL